MTNVFEVRSSLNDSDIMRLFELVPTEELLKPIKHNNKAYKTERQRLGSLLSPSSLLVKKNIHDVAFKLYVKGDSNYVSFIDQAISHQIDSLCSIVSEINGGTITPDVLSNYTIDDWADILRDYLSQADTIDLELFELQLRLIGKTLSEDELSIIKSINDSAIAEKQDQASQSNEEPETTQDDKAESPHSTNNDSTSDIIDTAFEHIIAQHPVKEESTMEDHKLYVGKIKIVNNYYNVTPIARVEQGSFIQLTENELDILLPASKNRNINLSYVIYNEQQVQFMQERFYDGQLILISFDDVEELLDNIDRTGQRNNTGYKVLVMDWWDSKKIRHLSADGFYSLKDTDILDGDLNARMIRVYYDGILDKESILINMRNGFFAGPFTVKYRPTNNSYYIQTQITDKHLLQGYTSDNCTQHSIEDGYAGSSHYDLDTIKVYSIKNPEQITYKDTITDEQLLESLKENLDVFYSTQEKGEGRVNNVLKSYENSVLSVSGLPEEIKQKRLQRVHDLLTAHLENEDQIKSIADIVFSVLLRSDDERTNHLVESLIEERPEFIDKLQSTRVAKSKVEDLRKEAEKIQSEIEEAKKVQSEINTQAIIAEKNEEYQALIKKHGLAEDIIALKEKREDLSADVKYYEKHKENLSRDTKALESQFVDTVNKFSEQMVNITFDGFMASKLLQAASRWETSERTKDFESAVEHVNNTDISEMSSSELIGYLVETVKKVRPQYDKNTIINVMVCITQGFLTVFSGAPGCGKTSFCNIIANVLGLTTINKTVGPEHNNMNLDRYIPVSVERGWTSKRDLVGYFNPLTKAFEESNRDVFDGLKLLDMESRKGLAKYPYIILLDEANLSPMEYYWADFMNVCDDPEEKHHINLGNDNIFQIPETLHFVATINNDHTTEILSPRLVDRAWIVSLPQSTSFQYGEKLDDNAIKLITWAMMKKTFGISTPSNISLSGEPQIIYDEIRKHFSRGGILISPRVDIAVKKYCYIASQLMEDDEFGNSASVVALDYAISQKILPKIIGSGEIFEKWLNDLIQLCKANNLLKSADILEDIKARGESHMKYYQFFN